MNAALLAAITFAVFALGYRFYSSFLARRIKGQIKFVHHNGTGAWPDGQTPESKHVNVRIVDQDESQDADPQVPP